MKIFSSSESGSYPTAPTLFEYDSFGNLTKQTLALAEEPTPANSPITELAYGVEATDEGVFSCTTQTRYNATGGPLVSVQKQLISQLSPTLAEKVIAVDERGLTSADWVVYNNSTKRTRYSSVPTSDITATCPLAIRKDGTWFAYGWDLTKNICEVFGPAGYIRTAYTYSPYGSVTATGDVTQPIQWSSEFNDAELALVYYNYRHYSPVDGRWISRDILEEFASQHLYCYLINRVVFLLDSLGLIAPGYEGATREAYMHEFKNGAKNNVIITSLSDEWYNELTKAYYDEWGGVNVENKEQFRSIVKDKCKKCISSLTFIAHGEKEKRKSTKHHTVRLHMADKSELKETKFRTQISDMFKGINFCKECIIHLVVCNIGNSPFLESRIQTNTGCTVKVYSSQVNGILYV